MYQKKLNTSLLPTKKKGEEEKLIENEVFDTPNSLE